MRYRPITRRDLPECLMLLPAWLGLPPSLASGLPGLWNRLINEPSILTGVMEDLARPPGERIQGWGVTVILPAPLVRRLALDSQPDAFVSRDVYAALNDPAFMPMTDREIGEANARGGLTMLILHFSIRNYRPYDPYVNRVIALANDTFRAYHDGYNLQALYYETGAVNDPVATASGFDRLTYRNEASLDSIPVEQRPALYGLTRKVAESRIPGPPARNAFEFHPPVFGFSATQRRLLWFSLFDDSDEALMPLLDVSVHGLKKLWRGIYERVENRMPDFFGADAAAGEEGKRGPEKRRQVLAYVRQRPEELRPWYPA